MLKNYVTSAIRNLLRYRVYSVINIAGLALSIAFCILTFLFIQDEWTYDTFHDKEQYIYRVVRSVNTKTGVVKEAVAPGPLAALLKSLPNVQDAIRVTSMAAQVQFGDQAFDEWGVFADPAIFDIFTFPLSRGDPQTALEQPNSIVLSAELAHKFFRDGDPIGKEVTVRFWGNTHHFMVTGVTEAIPHNSSIRFDFVFPTSVVDQDFVDNWSASFPSTYTLLHPEAQARDVVEEISLLVSDHRKNGTFQLQPLAQVHLDATVLYATNPSYGYILSGIALIILMIACINFVNLSLGLSTTRTKEIGVRKIVGAVRGQLIKQFLIETLLLSCGALTMGVVLAELILPTFNSLVDKTLQLYFNGSILMVSVALIGIVGIAAGSYPALVLSGLQPIEVFKKRLMLGETGSFGKTLLIAQFTLSTFFVMATLVMHQQLAFIQGKDLGFNENQIVAIPTHRSGDASHQFIALFRNRLSSNPDILGITGTAKFLGTGHKRTIGSKANGTRMNVFHAAVDYDYLETLEIPLIEGRSFDRNYPTDATKSVLINEVLASKLDRDNVIGTTLEGWGDPTIIGVVKDYHFESLHNSVGPLVIGLRDRSFKYVLVRIQLANVSDVLSVLKEEWRLLTPEIPFQYSFLNDEFDHYYRIEERWQNIVNYAASAAISIAFLGVLALAKLSLSRRTKEIGIRKVLGASTTNLVTLISKDFVKLVIIASLIASPVVYYTMNQWLQSFAYRIELGAAVFILGSLSTFVVILSTVGYQAVKVAAANPVDSLREE